MILIQLSRLIEDKLPNHNSWITNGFQCPIFTWQKNVFPIKYFEYFAKECSCQLALLMQCMSCFKEYSIWLVSQLWPTLCDLTGSSPKGSPVHGGSPGKNTGVDCQVLLQGIFQTQGSNPVLPHFRWILYQLSHLGNPYSPAEPSDTCPLICLILPSWAARHLPAHLPDTRQQKSPTEKRLSDAKANQPLDK